MDPRAFERELHRRCLQAVRTGSPARCSFDATLYRLAAQAIRTQRPDAARKLRAASRTYPEDAEQTLTNVREATVGRTRLRDRLLLALSREEHAQDAAAHTH